LSKTTIIARRIERLTREILGEHLRHLKAIRHLHEARAHLFSTPIDVLFLSTVKKKVMDGNS